MLFMMIANFLIIGVLEVFDVTKKKVIVNDESFVSFLVSKYLFYIMNTYLIVSFFMINYYFCLVVDNYEVLLSYNLIFFNLQFFLNFWMITFLFLNFLVFNFLVYFFYFKYKILDYSLINFSVLKYIFVLYMFILMSVVSTNLLILYMSMVLMQMYFYEFVYYLSIDKAYSYLDFLNNKKMLFFFMGDFLIMVSFILIYYFYGSFDLIELKSLLLSEKSNKLTCGFTINKGGIDEFSMGFYYTSIFYFMLLNGFFLKSIYIYYWKIYMPKNMNFSMLLICIFYNLLMMIFSSLILFKCEKLFDSFSLYRQVINQLMQKDMVENQMYGFIAYNGMFDFIHMDFLVMIWFLSIFGLFYIWLKKKC